MGKMGKLPDIVLWVGWDRSLCQDGVKGAPIIQFACPACIWDVYSQDAMGR